MTDHSSQRRRDRAATQVSGRALIAFFALTFAISWSAWLPMALASRQVIPVSFPSAAAGLVGAFGPSLAAVLVVAATEHGPGLRRLFAQLLRWRVSVGWYAFALLSPAVISLTAAAVWVAIGGAWPDFANPPFTREYPFPPELAPVGPWLMLPLVFLQYLLFSSPLGEEVGWRGYALPGLQSHWSALKASLLIGVIWAVWHLPLTWTLGHPLSQQFFGWFLLGIMADAIMFTWLYNSTSGSLLLVVLFHASIAVSGLFLSTTPASSLLTLVIKWLIVVGIVLTCGPRGLSSSGAPSARTA